MSFFDTPIGHPAIIGLTIAYFITSSITTFDKRLIQAKRAGNLHPDEQQMLPRWVGFLVPVHWTIGVALLLLNWQYTLGVYIIKFVLSVLPVLETVGNILLSPFADRRKRGPGINPEQDERRKLDAELAQAKSDLANAKLEVEQRIHSMRPDDDSTPFVPSFPTWWSQPSKEHLTLGDALEQYIRNYDLEKREHPDEPTESAMDRAKLRILDESEIEFDGDDQRMLNSYKMALQGSVMMQRMRAESKRPRDDD